MSAFELEISAPLLFGGNDPREGARYETLTVGYTHQPEEKMVMYYPDGSGYPGCAASLTVEYVTYKDHKGHCIDLWPILYCVPEIVDTLETMGWEYLD
jgi:hypothetical protein